MQNQGRDFLVISVKDNGPGICPQDYPALFKPFSRLSAHRDLNPNGNGLGLSICKRICNNLGGDIQIESRVGEWTQFKFWVEIKLLREMDLLLDSAPSRVARIQTMDVATKQSLLNKFQEENHERKAMDKLRIICADDLHYNLETLRLIFRNLDLVSVCEFYSNG